MRKMIRQAFITVCLLAAVHTAAAEVPMLSFGELYEKGQFSKKAAAVNGKRVRIAGYMAPPLKADADFFVLTRMPMAVCPFCENEADWPENIIYVQTRGPFPFIRFNRRILVEGVLQLGTKKDSKTGFVSRVRLVDSKVR